MLVSLRQAVSVSFGAPLRRSHLLCGANRRARAVALVLLTAALALALPSALPGAVIERDFVPGSGDGLLTYDTVNRREWLDVTVFAGEWSGVAGWAGFTAASIEQDFAFGEEFPDLAPGGAYADFNLAGIGDAFALAESAGIQTDTLDFETNDIAAERLVDLLGATVHLPAEVGRWTAGYLDAFDPEFPHARVGAQFFHLPRSAGVSLATLTVSQSILPANTGLMLYRNVVPEPSSIAIVFVVVLAFLMGMAIRLHRRIAAISSR